MRKCVLVAVLFGFLPTNQAGAQGSLRVPTSIYSMDYSIEKGGSLTPADAQRFDHLVSTYETTRDRIDGDHQHRLRIKDRIEKGSRVLGLLGGVILGPEAVPPIIGAGNKAKDLIGRWDERQFKKENGQLTSWLKDGFGKIPRVLTPAEKQQYYKSHREEVLGQLLYEELYARATSEDKADIDHEVLSRVTDNQALLGIKVDTMDKKTAKRMGILLSRTAKLDANVRRLLTAQSDLQSDLFIFQANLQTDVDSLRTDVDYIKSALFSSLPASQQLQRLADGSWKPAKRNVLERSLRARAIVEETVPQILQAGAAIARLMGDSDAGRNLSRGVALAGGVNEVAKAVVASNPIGALTAVVGLLGAGGDDGGLSAVMSQLAEIKQLQRQILDTQKIIVQELLTIEQQISDLDKKIDTLTVIAQNAGTDIADLRNQWLYECRDVTGAAKLMNYVDAEGRFRDFDARIAHFKAMQQLGKDRMSECIKGALYEFAPASPNAFFRQRPYDRQALDTLNTYSQLLDLTRKTITAYDLQVGEVPLAEAAIVPWPLNTPGPLNFLGSRSGAEPVQPDWLSSKDLEELIDPSVLEEKISYLLRWHLYYLLIVPNQGLLRPSQLRDLPITERQTIKDHSLELKARLEKAMKLVDIALVQSNLLSGESTVEVALLGLRASAHGATKESLQAAGLWEKDDKDAVAGLERLRQLWISHLVGNVPLHRNIVRLMAAQSIFGDNTDRNQTIFYYKLTLETGSAGRAELFLNPPRDWRVQLDPTQPNSSVLVATFDFKGRTFSAPVPEFGELLSPNSTVWLEPSPDQAYLEQLRDQLSEGITAFELSEQLTDEELNSVASLAIPKPKRLVKTN